MTAHTDHPLVRDYLDRLARAARTLPDGGTELVHDITGHLHEALPADAREAEVRTVLDRLGSPDELVVAAGVGRSALPQADPGRGRGRATLALVLLVAAELLFVVWFVAIPMWVVGLVLLAVSGVWTGREKLLGLLALGTGLPVVLVTVATAGTTVYQECGGGVERTTGIDGTVATTPITETCTTVGDAPPTWLAPVVIVLLLAYLVLQAWTVWRLTRQR